MILVDGKVVGLKKWNSKDNLKSYQVITCSFPFCFYGAASVDGCDVHEFWVRPESAYKVGQSVKVGVEIADKKLIYRVIENG